MSAPRVNSGTAKRISRRHREWYSGVAKCGARIGWPPDKRVEPLVSACLAWCSMKFSERQLESRDIQIDMVRREKSHPKLSRRAVKQGSERAWGCERQQFRNRRQRMSDATPERTSGPKCLRFFARAPFPLSDDQDIIAAGGRHHAKFDAWSYEDGREEVTCRQG
jgi:hypothetical protein